MTAQVGDRIVVESEKALQTSRSGVIEEVLGEAPPRLRVRWEDGRESILSPTAGAARIVPAAPAKAKAKTVASGRAKKKT